MNLSTLDEQGNYKETQVMRDFLEEWRDDVAKAKAENLPLPPKPHECIMPPAVLADDIELPPVTYPVDGFVEPDVKDEEMSVGGRNNDDDDGDNNKLAMDSSPSSLSLARSVLSPQELSGTPPPSFQTRPVRIRDSPRADHKVEHEHYMEKIDNWLLPALQRFEDPNVRDFEAAFHKFERDYFEDDADGFLKMVIDATTPVSRRMVMASARFLQ